VNWGSPLLHYGHYDLSEFYGFRYGSEWYGDAFFFHSLNFLVKIRRRSSHDNSQFPENEGIKLIQCSAKVRCGGFIPRISQKWRNGGTPKSSILWDFPWNKPSILGILHSNGGNGGLVAPRSLDSTPATRPRRARPPIARPIAEGGVPPRGYQRLPLK
jgi:hypothetical protein